MSRVLPAALVLAALAVALLRAPALLESWLLGFLALAGLSAGALGALAIGHLLREEWLAPVRAPLEAAAGAMPLVAALALPVLAAPEMLYPWAAADPPAMPPAREAWFSPWPFRLRGAAILVLWIVLARWLARPGPVDRRFAAGALAALVTTVTLAAQDWSLSRDPAWWGSLQGFAIWIEGMMAALAAAALASLMRGTMPDGATGAGEALERGLLALGLAALWLWFIQFITVWLADLPAEAGWYLRRMEGPWPWLKLGVAVPALLAGLALAAPPRQRPWRMAAVCALLLASHAAHLIWAVRPDAMLARPSLLLDGVVLGGLLAAWAWWWRSALRAAVTPAARAAPAPRPATASAP